MPCLKEPHQIHVYDNQNLIEPVQGKNCLNDKSLQFAILILFYKTFFTQENAKNMQLSKQNLCNDLRVFFKYHCCTYFFYHGHRLQNNWQRLIYCERLDGPTSISLVLTHASSWSEWVPLVRRKSERFYVTGTFRPSRSGF